MAWKFQFTIGKDTPRKRTPTRRAPAKKKEVTATAPEAENYDKYAEVIKRAFLREEQQYAAFTDQERPVIRPGRSSIYAGYRNFMPANNGPVQSDFPYDHLKFLQQLGMWNRHVSYAADNIMTLGNTDYEINFGEAVSDELAAEMRQHLRTAVKHWYEFSEGENSLDNDLLAQLATTGCISAEAVIKKDLSGIQKIVRVDPVNIRFAYDEKKDMHIPLQKAESLLSNQRGKYPGYIELNQTTYCYLAMRRMGELPYAIPPFISAIEDLLVENDMTKNFANIMRRLGMLGFLNVLVKAPKPQDGESASAYENRLTGYLEKIRPGVEEGFHKGVTIGFKDSHEFEMAGSNLNVQAGDNLLKMVKTLIFSGLKQDPNMHGENYSTTETFGRVILTKMTQQVANYQKTLAEFKARMFMLELIMAGYPLEMVEIEYNRAPISDRKHEGEADKYKIENLKSLYGQGIINNQQFAEEMGYDEPDQDEPRHMEAPAPGSQPGNEADETEGNMRVANTRSFDEVDLLRYRHRYGGLAPVFNYEIPEQCKPEESIAYRAVFKEQDMRKFAADYVNDIEAAFNKAVEKIKPGITKNLMDIKVDQPSPGVVKAILFHGLLSQWGSQFVTPIDDDVEQHIETMYRYFRKDTRPFRDAANVVKVAASTNGNQGMKLKLHKTAVKESRGNYLVGVESFFEIPQPVFELIDARAIEYLEGLDKIWLGKFITDPDTIERITRWVEEELAQGLEIGKDSIATQRFVDRFGEAVKLERWKIRRIVDTTANRTRNVGNVMYMNQAEVAKYEVVEIGDDRTCPWCLHMHGQVFEIASTVEKINKLTSTNWEQLPDISPFATKVPINQFKEYDAITLQSMGYDVPSYHPGCRGRVVADI